MSELIELLRTIRTKMDCVKSEITSEDLKNYYKNELVPDILQLRGLNRTEKITLDNKYKKIRELTQKLSDLQQTCDNLAFEAGCLEAEVTKVSPIATNQPQELSNGTSMEVEIPKQNGKSFDSDLALNEHAIRLRLLDEEQAKRITLKEKLGELKEEAKGLDSIRKHNTIQFNQLKPSIKQVIEKVDSVKSNIK